MRQLSTPVFASTKCKRTRAAAYGRSALPGCLTRYRSLTPAGTSGFDEPTPVRCPAAAGLAVAAGGLALAGGAVVYLTAPDGTEAGQVKLSPIAGGAQFSFAGRF